MLTRKTVDIHDIPTHPAQAEALIRKLRAFLGAERIRTATMKFLQRQTLGSRTQAYWLLEDQPIVDALVEFEKLTMGGNRPLKLRSIKGLHISYLLYVANLCKWISPTLSESRRKDHVDRLLSIDGQFFPLIVEWEVAHFYMTRYCASIDWFKERPEFIARSGELEWEVECKRLSSDFFAKLKSNSARAVADIVAQAAVELKLEGELVVEVPPRFVDLADTPLLDEFGKELRACLRSGASNGTLACGLTVRSNVTPRSNRSIPGEQAMQIPQSPFSSSARNFRFGQLVAGGRVSNDLVVRIVVPQMNEDEMRKHLRWKLSKAADACTGKRGAVLVFECSWVDDLGELVKLVGADELIGNLFKDYRHVAAFAFRSAGRMISYPFTTRIRKLVYQRRSSDTCYPEIAELDQHRRSGSGLLSYHLLFGRPCVANSR
jgi:hypothetical protein